MELIDSVSTRNASHNELMKNFKCPVPEKGQGTLQDNGILDHNMDGIDIELLRPLCARLEVLYSKYMDDTTHNYFEMCDMA